MSLPEYYSFYTGGTTIGIEDINYGKDEPSTLCRRRGDEAGSPSNISSILGR